MTIDHLSRWRRAIAGITAAAVFLGVGHLVAAFVGPRSSPFLVLGATMVDNTPEWLKEEAIRRFGTNDKLALFVSMAVVMVAGAVVIGMFAGRGVRGAVVLVGFGALLAWLAMQRPGATALFALPGLIGGVVSGAFIYGLLARIPARSEREATAGQGLSRRGFLLAASAAGVLAAATVPAARWIGTHLRDIVADRAAFLLPTPRAAAPAVTDAVDLPVPGITRFLTPNTEFYRIDTALQVPVLLSTDWQLRIHGMVERERRLDFDDLRSREAVESVLTLTCVSNEVGGPLAGTATWTGYRLTDLLDEAGVDPDADMLLSRSIDGFTAGTPLSALGGGLLAVGMNGEPLPQQHGYPARLIVPGLYGYVSATKWVVDLEVTRFDRAEAYWTRRGWSAEAPVKTAARIDVPSGFARLAQGPVVVAGVAWAQNRGIAAVEVQVDDQPWQPATLAAEYSTSTWRQWTWQWDATPGTHTLRVRATDQTGRTQPEARTTPIPNGATGWHSQVVTIR
ncbi:oxidoreductase [Nocardia mangyaensis]|uniref:Oxidoreductase n=1 Tax=Nocardia mangyaensis TaxID=2213200 RepID=A0A1J0VXQ5_9NOCA|nr:molybdopterin-dependent oxidoreductase [Nocardia mangyaensis]APE36836.1 oxidoreductase [Nocardia mangyaensis]